MNYIDDPINKLNKIIEKQTEINEQFNEIIRFETIIYDKQERTFK